MSLNVSHHLRSLSVPESEIEGSLGPRLRLLFQCRHGSPACNAFASESVPPALFAYVLLLLLLAKLTGASHQRFNPAHHMSHLLLGRHKHPGF